MGFWANQVRSIRKGSKLRRISLILGQFATATAVRKDFVKLMVERSAASDGLARAKEQLFQLIEDDPDLQNIMRQYGASRNDLRTLYNALEENAGQWAKGHWIPASALAFGFPFQSSR